MADRYLVNLPADTGGNWEDTVFWSESSGGSGGASMPISSDNIMIDDNSIIGSTTNSLVYFNFSSDIFCNSFTSIRTTMLWKPKYIVIKGTNNFYIYGNVSSSGIWFDCGGIIFKGTSPSTIDFTGVGSFSSLINISVSGFYFNAIGGEWTLLNNISMNDIKHFPIQLTNGKIILNGYMIVTTMYLDTSFIMKSGTILDATDGQIRAGNFQAIGTPSSSIVITGGIIAVRSTGVAEYANVTDNTASQHLGTGVLPFTNYGGLDGGGNTNWLFLSIVKNKSLSMRVSIVHFNPSAYSRNVNTVFSDTNGDVQTLNMGTSDNKNPIYYELETKEQEFGNRFHLKNISDKIVVFANYGIDSSLQASVNSGDYKQIPISLDKRVNIGESINLEGNFFNFKWLGETSTSSPEFEGIYLETITDLGFTNG